MPVSMKIAVPCRGHHGAVELRDSQYAESPGDDSEGEELHFSPAERVEFLAAAKAGKLDEVGNPAPSREDR